jgi:hypothetical protein
MFIFKVPRIFFYFFGLLVSLQLQGISTENPFWSHVDQNITKETDNLEVDLTDPDLVEYEKEIATLGKRGGVHRPMEHSLEEKHDPFDGDPLEDLKSRVRQRIAQLGDDSELVLLDKDLLEYADEIMAARKPEIEKWREKLAALTPKQERFISNGGQYILNFGPEPETLNEKILFVVKNHFAVSEITSWICNKLTAKLFIRDIVGPQYVAHLYGAFTNLDEVYNPAFWARLPQKFVVKGVLGSYGRFVRIVDKTDQKTIDSLQDLVKAKVSRTSTERIIVEEFLSSISSGRTITDFKFFCSNGRIIFVAVGDAPRSSGAIVVSDKCKTLYTVPNWQRLNVVYCNRTLSVVEKPAQLEEMIHVAQKLSCGFPLIRVDLYLTPDAKGQLTIKVGELTTLPAWGCGVFNIAGFEYLAGQLVQFPKLGFDSLVARDYRYMENMLRAWRQSHDVMQGIVVDGFHVNPGILFDSRSAASVRRLEELRNLSDTKAEVPLDAMETRQ